MAVVRIASVKVEAVRSVASSVGSSYSGHLISVTLAHTVKRMGRHLSLAFGLSPPPSGHVDDKVDSDNDFIIGSALPMPGPVDVPARPSEFRRKVVLLRTLVGERRNQDVEQILARDSLSSPTPRTVGIVAQGELQS